MADVRFIVLVTMAIALGSCAPSARPPAPPTPIPDSPYPSLILSNKIMSARVFLPDAQQGFYRGPRFDWSGMVGPVVVGKHWFFAPFRAPQVPSGNDDGIGPAEEFGMDSPPGYPEAKAGETFVKIGVGELIKPADPTYRDYHFYKPFAVARAPEWQISYRQDWVEFHQRLTTGPHGWGYDYAKRVSLDSAKPMITIKHRLTNTGTKPIDITWYCHNLINIDGKPIGPAYRVRFPFAPRFDPPLKPGDVSVHNNWLDFARPFPPHFGISADLLHIDATPAGDTATVWADGIGVIAGCDQPIVKYHFYAEATAACPEMFIRIRLKPSESKTWVSRYVFIIRG